MKSPLETLSIELIEMIVILLEFDDIRSVRLVSRSIEDKASQGHWTTFFVHKNIELSTQYLQDMIQVMKGGGVGCRLRHCTVTGIAREHSEEQEDTEYRRLLAHAFSYLKQYSSEGGVASLSLRIIVVQGPYLGKDPFGNEIERAGPARRAGNLWDAAATTFNIVATALIESQLLVYESFNVFGTIKGCSLNSNLFQLLVQKIADSPHNNFASLKNLTLSLSAPYRSRKRDLDSDENYAETTTDEEDEKEANQKDHERATLRRLPGVLRIMPALESFDLHWYNISDISAEPPLPSPLCQPMNNNNNNTESPDRFHLQHCALRGISASETELLNFLETVNSRSLTLEYVRIPNEGTWDSILNYLTDVNTPTSEYHLDDIRQNHQLVHYGGIPGSSKFSYRGHPTVGPSTITRSPDNAKEPLFYDFRPKNPLRSSAQYNWRVSKLKEFGPPIVYGYDFVALNPTLPVKELAQ